jgi:hypothetical protein
VNGNVRFDGHAPSLVAARLSIDYFTAREQTKAPGS